MGDLIKQVPISALSAPCTFLVAGEPDANKHPVKLQARSKDVLHHWYWGPMVHDFEGMEHKERIPVDYCHDAGQILGYIEKFDVTDYGLELSGNLVSLDEKDRSAEIVAKHKADVPYEASISFRHDSLVIEYVAGGASAEVNGQQLSGPLTIFRKWKLVAVAICPNGYDANTSTELSRGDKHVELSIHGGAAMPQTGTPTKPEATPETNLSNPQQPGTTPKPEEPQQTDLKAPDNQPANAKAEVITELKRFTDRFGAEGATYYVEGLSYEQALDKHARKTETDLQAKQTEISELQTKLQSVVTGEETPVSAGKTEGDKTKKSTGLGLGACIRIAGRDYSKN